MEIRTRYRKLSIATFVATICLVLWLLSLADGSALMAVGGRRSRLGSDAVSLVATLAPWPDDYEPDDAQYEASGITVNDDSPQRHNFHVADEDWVKFWAWAGNAYTIRTFDLDFGCDTVLELYDAEGRKLGEDDDGGEEPEASRIDGWTPSENGSYYVRVSQ